MNKNLKVSYILIFALTAIVVAWFTLTRFFAGVGLNFVGCVGIIITLLIMIFADNSLISRIKDLFIASCVFTGLELIIYLGFEFGAGAKAFYVMQIIFSILGLLFMGYVAFRFISEYKGVRYRFVEVLLGNEKLSSTPKKSKELSNGSLEDKPNNIEKEEQAEETVVIEESEE